MKEKNLYLLGVLLIAVSLLLFSDTVSAQKVVELSGLQQLVPGDNSILKSESVTLSRVHTIFEMFGKHDGFWIEQNGVVFQEFYYINDVLTPNPIGFSLPAGSYKVFPNCQKDPKKSNYTNLDATINLKLR